MSDLRNLWDGATEDIAAILQVVDYEGDLPCPAETVTRRFENSERTYADTLAQRKIETVVPKTGDAKRAARAFVHGDAGSQEPGAARFEISGVPDFFALEKKEKSDLEPAGVSLEDAWKRCRLAVIEELSYQQGASVESRPAVTEALLEGCIYECSREALRTPATHGACQPTRCKAEQQGRESAGTALGVCAMETQHSSLCAANRSLRRFCTCAFRLDLSRSIELLPLLLLSLLLLSLLPQADCRRARGPSFCSCLCESRGRHCGGSTEKQGSESRRAWRRPCSSRACRRVGPAPATATIFGHN